MSRLHELMEEVAATQRATLQRLNLQAAIERRLAAPAPRAPAWRGFAIGAAVAAAAVLLFAVGARRERTSSLSFDIDDPGHPGRPGDVIAPAGAQPTSVVFSDGSRVVVAANARARVDALETDGATVTVVDGTIDVNVVHRARTRWQVRAGGYGVQVTGTRFAVEWHPSAGSLEVRLFEGAVEIKGPGLPSGAARVAAGQRLHVGAGARGEVRADVLADVATKTGGATNHPPPPLGVAHPPGKMVALSAPTIDGDPATGGARARLAKRPGAAVGTSPAAPALPATPGASADWRALAAHARYHEALLAAIASNFEAQCQRLPADELLLLGDVARLDGDAARASRAYGAALTRFPKTDRATFSLGVIAFETRHDYADAARWFDRYLREHPTGPLATEAAGRLMESYARGGDSARARTAARTYLREHPKGPHAALARRIDAGP